MRSIILGSRFQASRRVTRSMTSPGAELPDDIQSCQALIEPLRTKLHAATERMAQLEELL
jgi:hypothetical protein